MKSRDLNEVGDQESFGKIELKKTTELWVYVTGNKP